MEVVRKGTRYVRLADLSDPLDCERVYNLQMTLEAKGRERYKYGEASVDAANDCASFISYMQLPELGVYVLLGFDGDELVGSFSFETSVSSWSRTIVPHGHDLFVLPEYRRRGYGDLLVEALEEYAKSRGCAKAMLETNYPNMPARRLYHQRGWRGTGLDENGVDQIVIGSGIEPAKIVLQMSKDFPKVGTAALNGASHVSKQLV